MFFHDNLNQENKLFNHSTLFPHQLFEKFISACKKIESDSNYQPYLSKQYLFNLAPHAEEQGLFSCMMIQPSSIIARDESGLLLGAFYQIIEIKKNSAGYYIDDFVVILVSRKDGEYFFYKKVDAEKGIFRDPLCLNIDLFLKKSCVHYSNENTFHGLRDRGQRF